MAVYKDMYIQLFTSVTKTIDELQKVQQECEEMYLKNNAKPPIKIASIRKPDDTK